MQGWKKQTLILLPSPVLMELLMEQYNLPPLLSQREEVFALLFPHPVCMLHPISK